MTRAKVNTSCLKPGALVQLGVPVLCDSVWRAVRSVSSSTTKPPSIRIKLPESLVREPEPERDRNCAPQLPAVKTNNSRIIRLLVIERIKPRSHLRRVLRAEGVPLKEPGDEGEGAGQPDAAQSQSRTAGVLRHRIYNHTLAGQKMQLFWLKENWHNPLQIG